MNNQRYIIRTENAGVFCAKIAERRGSEFDLVECRRLWAWQGAASLSQLATEGLSRDGSRFTVTVPAMTVLGVIEVIPCSDKALAAIDAVPVWRS